MATPTASGTASASSAPPAEVAKFFADVKAAIVKHPSLVAEIQGVFCFILKGGGPKGNDIAFCYTVDLKNAPGDVVASPAPTRAADCTLEYKSAADFAAINSGKLDLRRALFTGRLKIAGNTKVLQRMHQKMEEAKKREAEQEAKKKALEAEALNRARAPSYATMPSAMHQAVMAATTTTNSDASSSSLLAPVSLGGGPGTLIEREGSSVRSDASSSQQTAPSVPAKEKRMSLGAQIRGAFTVSASSPSQQPASSGPAAFAFSSPSSAVAGAASMSMSTPGAAVPAGAAAPAPQWQSDESAKDCSRCRAPFGIVRRRHHCRCCGRVFCQKCSSRNVDVAVPATAAAPATVSSRRFCDFCMARVYNAPPPDGLRIPDPAMSLSSRLANAAAAANSNGSKSSASPRFSITGASGSGGSSGGGSSLGSNLKSLFSSGSSLSARKESRSGSTASMTDLSGNNNSASLPSQSPPRGMDGSEATATILVTSNNDGRSSSSLALGLAPTSDHYFHQHQHRQVALTNNATTITGTAIMPVGVGGGEAASSSSSAMLISAPVSATAPASGSASGSGSGGGITRELVEEVVSGSTQDLQTRIQQLESQLNAMQSKLKQAETIPELVDSTPSLGSILSRVELVSALINPVLFGVALMGWRVVPAVLCYWAGSALFSGRWFLFLLYAGLTGWLVHCGYSTSNQAELLRRKMRVYGAAVVAFLDYRLTRYAVLSAGYSPDDPEGEAIYDAAHRRNAIRLFRVIRDLRGLWVKAGQYLSSRPDVMPQPFVAVLSALQDAMPARPLKEVKEAIEAELKKPISSIFASLEEKALAAASVGQVHRGKLKDGTVVAVKVQHQGMHTVISQDLTNLSSILGWLSYVEVGFDLKGVMEEWLKEVMNELDFTLEAKNMMEIRESFKKSKVTVTIPRVIPGLVGRGVLVMRFIEGVKASDKTGALDKLVGENKELLVSRVCTSFGEQIYRNGHFSADSHPGNLFVSRLVDLINGDRGDDTGEHQRLVRLARERKYKKALKAALASGGTEPRPVKRTVAQLEDLSDLSDVEDEYVVVLIDFGLCKKLPEHLRLAFGKLVIAAESVNFSDMIEAFGDMGMIFSTEAAGQDLENLQAMFANATPASQAKKEQEEKERKKKEKEEKEKAEAAAAAVGKDAAANANNNRKVTAWPPELMMYMRVSQLLTGVASSLESRHPFMQTWAHASKMAVLDAHYQKEPSLLLADAHRDTTDPTSAASLFHPLPSSPQAYFRLHCLPVVLPPLPLSSPTALMDAEAVTKGVQQLLKGGMNLATAAARKGDRDKGSDDTMRLKTALLEKRLRRRLAKLHEAGAFVGCQLVVTKRAAPSSSATASISNGGGGAAFGSPEILLSVAAGTCGELDPRPVTPATLFPALGASRVGVAAATAHLASSLSIDLDRASVGEFFPAFALDTKAGCSVGELLRCRSGVEGISPQDLATSTLTREKWSEGSEAVAKAKPLLLPRIAAASHGKPLPSSAPASVGGWSALLGGGNASGEGGSGAEGGGGESGGAAEDADANDMMSPVSHIESDDDEDDEESDGESDELRSSAPAEVASSAKKSAAANKKPALPSLAEDGDDATKGEGEEAEGESAASTAVSVAVAGPRVLPPKPAFLEVPAKLVDCFYRDVAPGAGAGLDLPSVGPDVHTDQTAHLFFGYGWAVGEMVAGMASRLGLTLPSPSSSSSSSAASSALSSLLSSVVEKAIGTKGHATFGLPLDSDGAEEEKKNKAGGAGNGSAGVSGGITAEAKNRIASLCLGGSGALEGITFDGDDDEDEGDSGDDSGKKASPRSPAAEDIDNDDEDEDRFLPDSSGDNTNETTMTNAIAAMELAEAMIKGGLADLSALMVKGREHFIDPRLVNMRKIKEQAMVPSMNLYASALGLACLLDYTAATHLQTLHRNMSTSKLWREAIAASASSSSPLAFTCEDPSASAPWVNVAAVTSAASSEQGAAAAMRRQQSRLSMDGGNGAAARARLLDLRALWVAHYSGLRLIGIRKKAEKRRKAAGAAGAASSGGGGVAAHTLVSAVGCTSLGGASTVLTDLASGVTVAVTVNRITADRALPRALIRMIFEGLGLGSPSSRDL